MSRRVVLIAVAAAILILGGWYALLWSPAQSDLDKAKARTQAAESQEQQLQAQINRLRDVQRSEPLRRAQLETLRTAIPDTPNLGQFILDVNDAATRSGIRFISISPTEPRGSTTATTAAPTTTTTGGDTTATTTQAAPTATAPAEIGLNVQVSGGYYQILDFMRRLDQMPRLVVTDSLNVSVEQTTGNLTVTMAARMFVRSIPAGFAGGTVATTTSTTAAAGAGGTTTTSAAGGATTTSAGARP